MIKITQSTHPEDLYDIFDNAFRDRKKELFIFKVSKDQPCVAVGYPFDINSDYCKEHGYFIAKFKYCSGCIVHMPEDISIMFISPENCNYIVDLSKYFQEWLKERNLNVATEGNDILIDNKKIYSWARIQLASGMTQSAAHFSIGTLNLEDIEAICKKPMKKIPGSLKDDYDITQEDILQLILDFTNKYFSEKEN